MSVGAAIRLHDLENLDNSLQVMSEKLDGIIQYLMVCEHETPSQFSFSILRQVQLLASLLPSSTDLEHPGAEESNEKKEGETSKEFSFHGDTHKALALLTAKTTELILQVST